MNTNVPEDDEMADEYDFSQGERGRLAKRLEGGYDIVVDGNEDDVVHVTAEDVRIGRLALDPHRKQRARKGA